MARIQTVFEIQPASMFGVPQEGVTVVPTSTDGKRQIVGATLHSRAGVLVGYGSLSEYRPDDHVVGVDRQWDDCALRLSDNFLWITLDAESPGLAYARAQHAADVFAKHLALEKRTPVTLKPILLQDAAPDGAVYPLPLVISLGSTTVYSIAEMQEVATRAAQYCTESDEKLSRALDYYTHSLWLFAARGMVTDEGPLSRNEQVLISSAFLNAWKAVTTILGDPSADRDHQRRHRDIGFGKEFSYDKVKRLTGLRNDYDVAHYSLRGDALEEVKAHYGEAIRIAAEVIDQYRQHLTGPQAET
jgi:hypothetical protein